MYPFVRDATFYRQGDFLTNKCNETQENKQYFISGLISNQESNYSKNEDTSGIFLIPKKQNKKNLVISCWLKMNKNTSVPCICTIRCELNIVVRF